MPSPYKALVATGGLRGVFAFFAIALSLAVAYLLRGVIAPLFGAFLLAYALDPAVNKLEAWRVPRVLGALLVVLALIAIAVSFLVFVVPLFAEEIRAAADDLPQRCEALKAKVDPWMLINLKLKSPKTFAELGKSLGGIEAGTLAAAVSTALFGTLGVVGVLLSSLIVPLFTIYLLIDFDRIVVRVGELIPRRWYASASAVARAVHNTLGGWVRGQLTANFVLAALYATGLRIVDIRLAVPIGVLTGMMAFVPYIGFGVGISLALAMAILDFSGFGTVVGVVAVMGGVQLLDALVITPRIVGRSVGLTPLEVLVTIMGAGTLFGFFGVLLAVPLGAVVKTLLTKASRAYLASDFYAEPESGPPPAPAD